jgi:hypothetical protein
MAETEQLMRIVVSDPPGIGQCDDSLRTRMHQFGITVTEHLRRSGALALNWRSAASASGGYRTKPGGLGAKPRSRPLESVQPKGWANLPIRLKNLWRPFD